MNYLLIKHLHIGFAATSGALFMLRGLWMLRAPALLQQRWVRVLPHVVDTGLLSCALILMFWSHQYPFVQPWLTAKLLALLAYIGLGTVALKRGRTRSLRTLALVAALCTFAYIIAVALTKQVWPLPAL